MKKILATLALLPCLFSLAPSAHAENLHFVSTGGQAVGGEMVYPYNFSVNGSATITSLICLDFNRQITYDESWAVASSLLPTDSSATSLAYRADAWIFSQLGTYSAADVQYAVWSILDPTDVQSNVGFTTTAQSLAQSGLAMAANQTLIDSGFFSQFVLYTPTSDQTGWTAGEPQRFLGNAAQAPEPSSLVLLGSGLIGAAGAVRRRLVRA